MIIIALLTSTVTMAQNDEKRAVKAIETVTVMKIKEAVKPFEKEAIKKIATKIKNKLSSDKKPTATQKSIGAFITVVKELTNPEYTRKTMNSETKFKLLQFKKLTIDYKATDSDLNFNFKTDGKETSFGLKMSF